MEYWWMIISCWLTLVHAKPSCKIYGTLKNAVICKAVNTDYTLNRGLVSDCNATTRIVLRDCLIADVNSDSFASLPQLRHLDMSRNRIKSLEPEIFNGLSKMNHLNLSFNSMTRLPSNLFHPVPSVLNLDLSENTLSSIEVGLLDPLTKLKVMNLSSNSLKGKELNPHLFDRNRQIAILDLSRNDMSLTPDNIFQELQSLEYLDLKRTFLDKVPTFATGSTLKMLKHLMLATNQIQKIDNSATFVKLDNLEILNLNENNIELINEDVFQPLKKLKGVYLRRNKLRKIPKELFQNIPKLVNLDNIYKDLANNYIEHFTVDFVKGTSLKNLNLSDNRITFMPEKFCLQLRDMGVILSKFLFMPNPWQCACLNELLQEIKSLNIKYNANYFDGGRSVCTVSESFSCLRS